MWKFSLAILQTSYWKKSHALGGQRLALPIRYLSFTVIFSCNLLVALSRNCLPDWILNFIFIFTELVNISTFYSALNNFGGTNPKKPVAMDN